jgi:hypothetical protein
MITIHIPEVAVFLALMIGAGLGAAVVLFSFLRYAYIDTDRARHQYMAHQLSGLRRKHNDYEKIPATLPSDDPRGFNERAITWLLDVVYRRGRP